MMCYDGLVRVGYYPNGETPFLSLMHERVSRMVEMEMIVYADRTSIISTISQVIIDWNIEFVAIDI